MTTSDKDKPSCFGKLDQVFPKTENGLRESPERCMHGCNLKTQCLKTAMTKDPNSQEVREEKVDNAYEAGHMTFLERWSKKKFLKKRKIS